MLIRVGMCCCVALVFWSWFVPMFFGASPLLGGISLVIIVSGGGLLIQVGMWIWAGIGWLQERRG